MRELRPHGPETEGKWRFGLHQLLDLPTDTPATVRYELQLFMYKPAGAEVTVFLKTARAGQVLMTLDALDVTMEASAPAAPAA
ncbi:hypothetical protein Q5H93_00685 [Hymenobacter sp. ASUV-10]|uniref:Uncharacterized protein n=1 Tax=Hymenobacter aranciens TaxID=3063996 RepID=A0ABT9B4Q9_9BACT|nr:hypothetical protein [Hymenobacter sp. ASUV-10]MDO7873229.1 hypothetical protein [Hymenobacter sp. ASUV-10]